jgi:cysteine synthase A
MTPLSAEAEVRFQGLGRLIGNTPMLSVDYTFRGRPRRIFAKSESLNLTGSVKDRVALHLLRRAYETRALRPGAVIIEAALGNAAISIAAVGRALGHQVALFMPDGQSADRMGVVRSLGASIYPISEEGGGFLGAVGRAEELASHSPGSYQPRAFANDDSCGAHEATTAPEIHWQLGAHGLAPDAFVAGVGTGGTVMGAGRYLVAHHPEVRIHPVETSSAPILSKGKPIGRHRVPGFSAELVPPLLDLTELDHVLSVDDGDAILMAQKLARTLGLGVGISSGANFLAAVLVQDLLGSDAIVTTLFPDSNRLYLGTDLFREERPGKEHLTPWVEPLGFTALNRACPACDTSADLVRLAAGV